MIALAIDTALGAVSVAVGDPALQPFVRTEVMERGQQERLAPLVEAAMREAGVAFSALERIGVTIGPGGFTGLRVGLAFAKGLSVALGAPCIGVGTLEALAASAPSEGLTAAMIGGRAGQVYLQLFRGGAPLGPAEVLALDAAERRIVEAREADRVTLIGPDAGSPAIEANRDTRAFADPLALLELVAAATPALARPRPLYLRPPDAKTIAERRAASPA